MSRVNFGKFVSNRLASLVSWDKAATLLGSLNVQDALTELANRTFSTYFNASLASNETTTSTTSTTFINKINANSVSLQGGTYLYLYCAESSNSKKAGRNELQVLINSVVLNQSGIASTEANDWRNWCGFGSVVLPSGVVPLQLQYRAFADTASIRRARLFLFRVGA